MSRVGLFAGEVQSDAACRFTLARAVVWTLNDTVNSWDVNPPEGDGIPSGLAVLAC